MRALALAILAGLGAGSAGAGNLVAVAPGAVVAVTSPLEVVRHERSQVGRRTAVPVGAAAVQTIEWRRPVEVRARTESGEPLTEADRQFVRGLAQDCARGEPVGIEELLERNGTYVVELDCAWFQGLEGVVSPQ